MTQATRNPGWKTKRVGLACSAKERIASLKEKGREPRADHDESDWDDKSDSEVEEEENIEEKGEKMLKPKQKMRKMR